MKKCSKCTKKGFTLVEMVLVIAIIVILASVMIMGVSDYIQRARNAAASVGIHHDEIARGVAEIDGQMAG